MSFQEAATALKDPMAATGCDPDHRLREERFVTFGVSEKGRLLVVAHTDENDTLRIISARVASKGERKIYELDFGHFQEKLENWNYGLENH